jgi:two-component system, OmpR family, phosphate regulon sensor histidine kinase PhoR
MGEQLGLRVNMVVEFIIELPETGLAESKTFILDANITRVSDIERIKVEFSDIYD